MKNTEKIIETIARELSGQMGISALLSVMYAGQEVLFLEPQPGKHDGGFAIRYRVPTKNNSNAARVLAEPGGKRTVEFLRVFGGSMVAISRDEGIDPTDLPRVWEARTGVNPKLNLIVTTYGQRIDLGKTTITRTAASTFPREFVDKCLSHHSSGDWGNVLREDWRANDEEADAPAGHVLSSYTYKTSDGNEMRLWIETSWNERERYTVAMLPEER